MTYRVLQVLLIVLPLIIVPNKYDCFRTIKESLFHLGAISIFAASFFDIKLRKYHNKYFTYFLIYCGILFFRYFSIPYIWGGVFNGRKVLSAINPYFLLPIFNVILGILLLKIIIETLSRKQVENLIKLSCVITFIVSLHLILQRFNVIQIYGRSPLYGAGKFTGTGWTATNRTIAFLGNPMIAGGYVAIASQLNLFFRNRLHYIFYAIGFIGVCLTFTTSAIVTFVICAFLFFIIYKRSIGIVIGILLLLGGLGAYHYDLDLIGKFYSFSDRLEVWAKTIKLWWEVPYTGMGIGSFRTAGIYVTTTHWWQAHCEPLQILQEMGIIGLGFVGLLLTDFFRRIKNRKVFACALVVVAGVINSFMSFPLHIAPLVYVLILSWAFKEILQKEE